MAHSRFFTRYATALERRLFRLERKYRAMIYKELQREQEQFIETGDFTTNLQPIIEQLYREEGVKIMTAQYKLLGGMDKKSDFFSTAWRVWVEHFIGTRMAQKIVRIDETTREAVQRVISNNVGVPRREIAKQLTMFNRKRAMAIARTEVAQMAVESQRQGAEAWKAETNTTLYKMWMHRGAADPRTGHLALDGTTIPENEMFTIVDNYGNSERALTPHASGLSAGNVVNCGCTVIYVSENYYNTRLKR
jgi:hypothetical protein